MPAGPKDTIWKAEPHTVAKIDILEAYLVAYFQILGSSRRNQAFLFVDGFAGPNQYTNRLSGSPTAAIKAATTAMHNLGNAWKAGAIHFAFVERDRKRYKVLRQGLLASNLDPRILVHTYNAEFTQALPLIKQEVPEPFQSDHPLFVFIDPFGATGAPFNSVAEILNSPCSEVLINLDADGVTRIFNAKQSANHEAVLTEIFGDASWENELRDEHPFAVQCRKVLHLYKNRLRTLTGVRYIYEVEMQGATGSLNYFLVFASKHQLGLQKMKEAMTRIAKHGTYKFADSDVELTAAGQKSLFQLDEAKDYHTKLFEAFKNQHIAYDSKDDEITAFALNHTPFINAKSMLTLLEKEEMITALSVDKTRKRGTFDTKVRAIHFHGRPQDGFQF